MCRSQFIGGVLGGAFATPWSPSSFGSRLAVNLDASLGCYTDAACLFVAASSQYLSKSSPTFAPTTKMTIRLWYKPTTIGAYQTMCARWDPNQRQFVLYVSDSGKVHLYVAPNVTDAGTIHAIGATVLSAGTGYEITVVYDGTLAAADRVAIYVDGVAESLTITGTIPSALTTSTSALEVGRPESGNLADGALARLGFSSQALSGAALTAAHTSTFWADMTSARQADWFSFYNLCERSGTRVDSTGLNDLAAINSPGVVAGPGEGRCVNNSPVKRWEDQSGNARHLTQATIAKQPLWIASGQNGLPVVRSDGSDDDMAASFTIPRPFAYAFAGKASGSASKRVVHINDIAWGVGDFGGSSNAWAYYPNQAGSVENLESTPTSCTSFGVAFVGLESNSVLRSGVNGSYKTSDPTDSASDGSALRLFSDTATEFATSDIGQLVLVSATPSDGERASLHAYLKAKWGTP